MKLLNVILLFCCPVAALCQQFTNTELARYKKQASHVTIIRDTWGIPHIYGKTDADAVFGLLYAQCEDDFHRVEMNSLEMLGRTAEVNGLASIYQDLEMRLIYDSSSAILDYKKSPLWFRKLLDASADGVNYYLSKNSGKALVLKHFEPWYPLMRTDGSISATSTGGITLDDLKSFYSGKESALLNYKMPLLFDNVSGSNGFAVSPFKSVSHNALLYINPHVTFYFREEVHMISEEGLNAYGAVTWGQFFIYQGFNQHCGWMHTSSHADVADVYKEKITRANGAFFYSYDDSLQPVVVKPVTLFYAQGNQGLPFTVTTYSTHHGPVLGGNSTGWFSVKEYNRSLKALIQSWLRIKSNTFADFQRVMDMRANTSNNTVYADDQGNIAYWHGDFMPIRDSSLDWSSPVDGSTSSTEWKGIHKLKDIVQVHNPKSGWIQNCNSTPYTVAGESSPLKKNFPAYMAPDGQNPRALNAMRLLEKENYFTIEKLIATGYDTYLSAFDILLPALFQSYNTDSSLATASLKEAIGLLHSWNRKSSESSIATTIAIEWATIVCNKIPAGKTEEQRSNLVGFLESVARNVSPKEQVSTLANVIGDLQNKFGTWKVSWGTINRYQRADHDLGENFNDAKPSKSVGAASSQWGCLPSYSTIRPVGSKFRYGVNGNSFVAAVEFGKKVRAKTILTGGEGTVPSSKHFSDQTEMYIQGKFKEAWFYKEHVLKHIEKRYHP